MNTTITRCLGATMMSLGFIWAGTDFGIIGMFLAMHVLLISMGFTLMMRK